MGLTRTAKLAFISIFFSLAILLALSIILVAVIDLRGITEKQGNSIGGGMCMYAIQCHLMFLSRVF